MKKNTVHFFSSIQYLLVQIQRSSLKENHKPRNPGGLYIIQSNWYSRPLSIWNGVVARLTKTMLWEGFLASLIIEVECDWNP